MLAGVEWASQLRGRKASDTITAGTGLTISCRIQLLRDVKECFGTAFKIVPAEPTEPDSLDLIFSCYGIGYVNANRSLA